MSKNENTKKIDRHALKRLMKELLSHRILFFLAIVTTILGSLGTILAPLILAEATTELFNGIIAMVRGLGTVNFDRIAEVLVKATILNAFSTVFAGIQGYIVTTLTEAVTYDLRNDMMEKLNRLPMAYYESKNVGETLSVIINDSENLGGSLAQTASSLLTAVTTMVGMGLVMLYMNVPMALIVLTSVPVSLALIKLIVNKSQLHFIRQQRILGNITGLVEESFAGVNVIRGFNKEEDTLESFQKLNYKLQESGWRAMFYSSIIFPLMDFVNNLSYVLVVLFGALFALKGIIAVGMIQAFIQYSNRFFGPISTVSQSITLLQNVSASAKRIYSLLDEKEEDQLKGEDLDVDSVHGHVATDHVSFGYLADQTIIKDFSIEVKSGEKVAIVGPTGAGKSTIVKLLMRFYDVNSGKILLDDKDISTYSRSSFQQATAMVLQDTWLFKGSIMENVRYGNMDATDEEVINACKSARVHDYILTLPGGYNFELNEDADNVSQGQKQLLTIARALIADRPILILDEATSSVDTRTEQLIQDAMDKLMEGRTSFVIAHRLSTIKNSDTILYMEDGDVVEQGSHDELMALGGRYAALYKSQFAA